MNLPLYGYELISDTQGLAVALGLGFGFGWFLERWLDLSLVYLTPTSIGAQLLGGLLLGAGFIIGGYCPGTSVTAAATGSGDGAVFLGGFACGLVLYAVAFSGLELWANAASVGELTLPQVFGVPYGVLVLGLAVMAALMFVGAEWAERRFSHWRPAAR